MRVMDRQYTEFTTSGASTMQSVLQDHGYTVNKKRIARLMKVMGLQAIYPKNSQSKYYLHLPDNGSKLYQGIKYYINYYNERRHHQGI